MLVTGKKNAENSDMKSQLDFATIMESWNAVDGRLEILAKANFADEDHTYRLENKWLDMQSQIMEAVSLKQASSIEDVHYKMALWFRDTPDLELVRTKECRTGRLLCSILRDLTELTGRSDLVDIERINRLVHCED
ncbi:MAG: hypothetical protein ABJG15_14970 [Hyphomonadaceae bacterium]